MYSFEPQPAVCPCVGIFSAQHTGLVASSSSLRVKSPKPTPGWLKLFLASWSSVPCFVVLDFLVVWACNFLDFCIYLKKFLWKISPKRFLWNFSKDFYEKFLNEKKKISTKEFLRKISMKNFCEKFLWKISMKNFYKTHV